MEGERVGSRLKMENTDFCCFCLDYFQKQESKMLFFYCLLQLSNSFVLLCTRLDYCTVLVQNAI